MRYDDKKFGHNKDDDEQVGREVLPAAAKPGPQKKAYSVSEFCGVYGISRSKAYKEMKAGRLKSRNHGRRLIGTDDADDWFNGQ